MISRFLIIVIFSTTLLAQNDINTIIENINNAPIKERYVHMNQLKQLLKNKNKEFRKTIIKKLQTANMDTRNIDKNALNNIKMNHNINMPNNVNVSPSSILKHTPDINSIKQKNPRVKVYG